MTTQKTTISNPDKILAETLDEVAKQLSENLSYEEGVRKSHILAARLAAQRIRDLTEQLASCRPQPY